MKLITTLFLASALLAQAAVNVTVGDISDKRTTGKFFQGLEVELKVSGPEMANCKGLRVVLKEAKDNTGKAIPEKEGVFNDGRFNEPQKAFGGFGNGKKKEFDEYQLKLELENPDRSAKSFSLDAAVELLIPSQDPNSVITVDVAKVADQPLAQEALKATGATITFKAPTSDRASYTITDPKGKIASIEFCSPDGKALETNGRMSSNFSGSKSININLREKAPAGMVAKIYLITDKSIVSAPVKLPGVPLP
jgi:hypothetical protein